MAEVQAIRSTADTYIGTKLVTRAAFTAATVAKHDALICTDFTEFAVDEEPMEDLIADHLRPFKRRHGIATILIVGRLWTDGVTLQACSLHHTKAQ